MHPLTRSALCLGVFAWGVTAHAQRCDPASILKDLTSERVCDLSEAQLQAIAREYGAHRSANCGDSRTYADPSVALNQVHTMQKQLCDARRNPSSDALPKFEAAIYAMTDGRRLNPCTYDPKADNFAILNAPEYLTYNNRQSYDNGITYRRLELYLERRADERQAACFLAFLRSGITGEEWHPLVKSEPFPAPKPVETKEPAPPRFTPPQAPAPPAPPQAAPPMAPSAAPATRPDAPMRPSLPPPPVYTGRRSGHLTYSGPPVPQNGEIVFSGLPAGSLHLVYDTSKWRHRLTLEAGGTQRLILISTRPGMAKKVEVEWSLENTPGR